MTKKDFFRILIKIFALYFIISIPIGSFINIPYIIPLYEENDILMWIIMILSILLVIGIFILLLIFPDKIITFFKLDKGYDNEKIDLKDINSVKIIEVSVIIIGGIFFIRNISPLLATATESLCILLGSSNFEYYPFQNFTDVLTKILYLIIGLLMFTNYRSISRFLLKINNKNDKINKDSVSIEE